MFIGRLCCHSLYGACSDERLDALSVCRRFFGGKCCRSLIVSHLSQYHPFFSGTRALAYHVRRIIQDRMFVRDFFLDYIRHTAT